MQNPAPRQRPHRISHLTTHLTMLAVAVASSPVLAQASELRPPKPTEDPSAPQIMMYVIAAGLAAVLIFAATLKPKRGHQD